MKATNQREEFGGAGAVCACRGNPASSPIREWRLAEWRLARRTRGAAAWALPSVTLALVPKCPLCIAAYLALGGGLSVSLSTAMQLRTALVWLCWSALMLLAVRMSIRCIHRVLARVRTPMRAARRHEGCSGMTRIRASARLT